MEVTASVRANHSPHAPAYDEIRLELSHMYRGHLLLVNGSHPIMEPQDAANLVPLDRKYAASHSYEPNLSLEKTCYEQLQALLKACRATDRIAVVSGYRSREAQAQIYETSLRDNGPAFTASYVARPNESEHQTGLAVDVGERTDHVDYIRPSFPDRGVCSVFKRLAAEYGFIQRYQAGKEAITNIACEPWHFRYVGFPHSAIIEQRGFCLEEYIEYVKQYTFQRSHLVVEHQHATIEIYYVPAKNGITNVPVARGNRYCVSGNNQDGFVVTVFHRKGSDKHGCA